LRLIPGVAIGLTATLAAFGAAGETITIATVPSVPSASTFIAADKGYFKAAGLDVAIETIDSLSKAIPFLAQNKIQLAQGGVSAGYFNAVAEGVPIIMALEGGSTPLYHQILLRPGLKDVVKGPRDLIGRSVALSSPGSSSVYELGQVLATVGLRLASVEVKYLGFQQSGPALSNGALDAALLVAPFTDIAVEQGIGVRWLDPEAGYIKPLPMSNLSYMTNLDWAKDNRDTAEKLFLALARAGRDYCQAYHHGPNRGEVLDILIRNKVVTDRALLDRMDWQARDPNGRFNLASIMSIQSFFRQEGMAERESPAERLATNEYADAAAQALGPFVVINKDSKLEGCR
jgi:NitT/TauT family transport system substrate-binding protein